MVPMNKNIFVLLFFLILTLTSCKTKEKVSELNYMQNVEQVATETSMKSALNIGYFCECKEYGSSKTV